MVSAKKMAEKVFEGISMKQDKRAGRHTVNIGRSLK